MKFRISKVYFVGFKGYKVYIKHRWSPFWFNTENNTHYSLEDARTWVADYLLYTKGLYNHPVEYYNY